MAGREYSIVVAGESTASDSLIADGAKNSPAGYDTFLQIITAADGPIKIKEIQLAYTSSFVENPDFMVITQTSPGASGTAIAVQKLDTGSPDAARTTALSFEASGAAFPNPDPATVTPLLRFAPFSNRSTFFWSGGNLQLGGLLIPGSTRVGFVHKGAAANSYLLTVTIEE